MLFFYFFLIHLFSSRAATIRLCAIGFGSSNNTVGQHALLSLASVTCSAENGYACVSWCIVSPGADVNVAEVDAAASTQVSLNQCRCICICVTC